MCVCTHTMQILTVCFTIPANCGDSFGRASDAQPFSFQLYCAAQRCAAHLPPPSIPSLSFGHRITEVLLHTVWLSTTACNASYDALGTRTLYSRHPALKPLGSVLRKGKRKTALHGRGAKRQRTANSVTAHLCGAQAVQ